MTKQQNSYIYAGFSILAWSSVSTAFKLGLGHLSPVGLLFISSLVATGFLAIVNAFTCQGFAGFSRNAIRSIPAGFLNPYLYYVILFTAYSRLRAQEAQSLNYTWAIVLSVLMVVFMKESFRIKDMGALLISFVGVLVISTRGKVLSLSFDDAWGTALALGSSLVWALYWVVSLRDKRDNQQKLFYNFLIGSGFIMAHIIISKSQLLLSGATLRAAILSGVWVGIFEMGLTFLLWLKALQLTDNTAKISNMVFLTPFISMFFIQNILKEPIHPATVIGLVLIVASNLLQKSSL
jgi:drug/metabolite transporter (DMT)-like permease